MPRSEHLTTEIPRFTSEEHEKKEILFSVVQEFIKKWEQKLILGRSKKRLVLYSLGEDHAVVDELYRDFQVLVQQIQQAKHNQRDIHDLFFIHNSAFLGEEFALELQRVKERKFGSPYYAKTVLQLVRRLKRDIKIERAFLKKKR